MARMKFCVVWITVVLLEAASLAAVKPNPAPVAPIPPQISAAKKAFISNAGGDKRWFDDPIFTGGPQRAYNEFYGAIKAAGLYELVGTPSEADLVLEIRMFVPRIEGDESGRDFLSRTPYDPQFRLIIRDPKSNTLLWAFTEHVQWALLQGNRDKNLSNLEQDSCGPASFGGPAACFVDRADPLVGTCSRGKSGT